MTPEEMRDREEFFADGIEEDRRGGRKMTIEEMRDEMVQELLDKLFREMERNLIACASEYYCNRNGIGKLDEFSESDSKNFLEFVVSLSEKIFNSLKHSHLHNIETVNVDISVVEKRTVYFLVKEMRDREEFFTDGIEEEREERREGEKYGNV